jgi:hypothetical protein
MGLATRAINRPATLLRRTEEGEDAHGNPKYEVEEVDVVCELQQFRRQEARANVDDLSDSLWDLYLPAGTEVDSGDAIVVDGRTYEILGEPWEARDPFTERFSHIEATVRRTAGAGDGE